ncbi:hypothetical protein IR085_07155, partial [Gemella palaticanis]|nr:hypothetical protein [Gemella palaticanis]NYS47946.1 hypothetical protein [Gemella palaticanis]
MNNCNTEIEIIKGEDITKSLLQIKDNNIQVENGHRIVKINNQKHFI